MAIEQVERSLFRGRELSVKKILPGNVFFMGIVSFFPLTEEFATVSGDTKIEISSSSHDGDVTSQDKVLSGAEINRARIKTERTRLFTRRPILRYTP